MYLFDIAEQYLTRLASHRFTLAFNSSPFLRIYRSRDLQGEPGKGGDVISPARVHAES
jgi:hypothetical protein